MYMQLICMFNLNTTFQWIVASKQPVFTDNTNNVT